MSGQYPWGPPYTPAQQAWMQQQAYATQAHANTYAAPQGMSAAIDPASAHSYAAMQHSMIMHQRSVALSNANAAVQAAQQRNHLASTAPPSPSHPNSASSGRSSVQASHKLRGQKRQREQPTSKPGPVKVPQNLLQLVPSKYRYAFDVGDSQEDIEKWRAARRRRYPSAANRAAAQQQQAEKAERGEVVAQPNTGRMHRKPAGQPSAQGAAAPAAPRATPAAPGLVDYSSESDDGAAPEEKPSTAKSDTPMQLVSAAAAGDALGAPPSVASGAVAASVVTAETVSPRTTNKRRQERPKQGKRNSGIVRGGEHLTASAVGSRAGTQRDASRGQRTQHRRGRQQRTSLLRQLLAGEMRKENSAILQCVRYLRQHDFLADVPLHGAAADASSSSDSSGSNSTSVTSSDGDSSDSCCSDSEE